MILKILAFIIIMLLALLGYLLSKIHKDKKGEVKNPTNNK